MKPEETHFVMVTDSREQKPLSFLRKSIVKGLKTGDYSVEHYEDKITFEHKSVADIISTCDSGTAKSKDNRTRFKKELQRMKDGFDFYCIVISGSADEILPKCRKIRLLQVREGRKRVMSPETRAKAVMGSLRAFRVDYNCHFYFLGSRERAASWIVKQCEYFMRHKSEDNKGE